MFMLPTNLGSLAGCAAKESWKYAQNAINVRFNADATYEVASTDGKRLMVVSGPCVSDADALPETSPIHSAPNGETSALIPVKEWTNVFKSAGKLKLPRYSSKSIGVATVLGKDVSTFAVHSGSASTFAQPANYTGRFPPYQDVLPKRAPLASVKMDAKMLAETLKAIEAFTDDNTNHRVELSIHEKDRITLHCENSAGQKTIVLQMGMV